MTHMQRSGYMFLGAGLLALGIIIGRMIETRTVVQSDGVFEKIQCRELEVVDSQGNKAIALQSHDTSNGMVIFDSWGQGQAAVFLGTIDEVGNGLSVYDRFSRLKMGLTTSSGWDNVTGSGLSIYDDFDQVAVGLSSRLRGNEVQVYNRHGELVEEMVSSTDNWVSFKDLGLEDKLRERLKNKTKQSE